MAILQDVPGHGTFRINLPDNLLDRPPKQVNKIMSSEIKKAMAGQPSSATLLTPEELHGIEADPGEVVSPTEFEPGTPPKTGAELFGAMAIPTALSTAGGTIGGAVGYLGGKPGSVAGAAIGETIGDTAGYLINVAANLEPFSFTQLGLALGTPFVSRALMGGATEAAKAGVRRTKVGKFALQEATKNEAKRTQRNIEEVNAALTDIFPDVTRKQQNETRAFLVKATQDTEKRAQAMVKSVAAGSTAINKHELARNFPAIAEGFTDDLYARVAKVRDSVDIRAYRFEQRHLSNLIKDIEKINPAHVPDGVRDLVRQITTHEGAVKKAGQVEMEANRLRTVARRERAAFRKRKIITPKEREEIEKTFQDTMKKAAAVKKEGLTDRIRMRSVARRERAALLKQKGLTPKERAAAEKTFQAAMKKADTTKIRSTAEANRLRAVARRERMAAKKRLVTSRQAESEKAFQSQMGKAGTAKKRAGALEQQAEAVKPADVVSFRSVREAIKSIKREQFALAYGDAAAREQLHRLSGLRTALEKSMEAAENASTLAPDVREMLKAANAATFKGHVQDELHYFMAQFQDRVAEQETVDFGKLLQKFTSPRDKEAKTLRDNLKRLGLLDSVEGTFRKAHTQQVKAGMIFERAKENVKAARAVPRATKPEKVPQPFLKNELDPLNAIEPGNPRNVFQAALGIATVGGLVYGTGVGTPSQVIGAATTATFAFVLSRGLMTKTGQKYTLKLLNRSGNVFDQRFAGAMGAFLRATMAQALDPGQPEQPGQQQPGGGETPGQQQQAPPATATQQTPQQQ